MLTATEVSGNSGPVLLAQEVQYHVNVITLDDRTFQIETSEMQTLHEFRLAVAHATGVAPESQRLISNGRLLFGENQPLGLEHNSFVHLAPITRTNASNDANNRGGNNDNDFDDSDYTANVRLNAHMSQLNGFAWLIIVYFSLVSWRLLMIIMFEQDDSKQPEQQKLEYLQQVLIPTFITSLFGVGVGLYGVWAASHRHLPVAAHKLRVYALLISLLALFYFLSSLQYMDSNSVMAVFIIQMMFWYCVLQARITEHAFTAVHGMQAPSAVSAAVQDSSQVPTVIAVPQQPSSASEANNSRRDATVMV